MSNAQNGRQRWSFALAVGLAMAATACGDPPQESAPTPSVDILEDGSTLADVCEASEMPCIEAPDWSRDAVIEPGTHRANIYGLPDDEWSALVEEGLRYAQVWPVAASGLLLPYQPMAQIYDPDTLDPTILELQSLSLAVWGFGTLPELYDWLGLPPYEEHPIPPGAPEGDVMGAGIIETPLGDALTFGCTSCHAGRLLGRTVMGLTNRVTRANRFFELGKTVLGLLDSIDFQAMTGATDDEMEMLYISKENAAAIGAKEPMVLGLDTSLAQVGLSLARRGLDPYASKSPEHEVTPRSNGLELLVADSKPMPWWTLKYKTRWLADGSIVSGNPVHTNFLWNEIGRGSDLHELETWMADNPRVIESLTAAVFASRAPRWTDFFAPETLDLSSAKRGQAVFLERCASCHGTYEKAWDAVDAVDRSHEALMETTRVLYHAQTPVVDVGTDPQRAQGMSHFAERLNELSISKYMDTVVEVQTGYVPPPLTGIWARYPYLHNNSVPTLCDLLTPAAERTAKFWQGPSEDVAVDFDVECVGFPTGDAVPESWKTVEDAFFDTSAPGLSNQGHESMFLSEDGTSALSAGDRGDLIVFLKTL